MATNIRQRLVLKWLAHMRIRQIVRSTIAVLFFVLPVQLHAQPAYKHPQTGYLFPVHLGSTEFKEFIRGEIHQYPDKGLGTSVSYKNDDAQCFADFYLYNLGLSRIPDGVESDIVHYNLSESESNIFEYERRGVYQNVRRITPPGLVTHLGPRTHPFMTSVFEFVAGEERRVSWLFVTGTRQHVLKLRYTCHVSHLKLGKDALGRLITSFFETNAD